MSGLFVFLQNLLLEPYIIDMERFKIFILVLSIVSLSVFLDGCDKDEPLDEVIIPPLEEINPDNENLIRRNLILILNQRNLILIPNRRSLIPILNRRFRKNGPEKWYGHMVSQVCRIHKCGSMRT